MQHLRQNSLWATIAPCCRSHLCTPLNAVPGNLQQHSITNTRLHINCVSILCRALAEILGYELCTEVQAASLPTCLAGGAGDTTCVMRGLQLHLALDLT